MPRAWNTKLNATIVALGFQKSSFEHNVYARKRGGGRLIVVVYVDDLIFTCSNLPLIKEFKEMKSTFQMSGLGLLSYYLGTEVK